MGKNRSRKNPDYYSQRAKKEGYPARSVYKLEEIQQKFHLIKPEMHVLDIGAAPGSWTLYLHRAVMKNSGTITAVDLKDVSLSPLPPEVTFLKGDAFSPEIRSAIAAKGPFHAVISDAAPATTGNRTVDTARSEQLAEDVLSLAGEVLASGGNFAVKIFQGGGEQMLLERMRDSFSKVKAFKPKASRDESYELFLIGMNCTKTSAP